jgi:subtilase family serine protease
VTTSHHATSRPRLTRTLTTMLLAAAAAIAGSSSAAGGKQAAPASSATPAASVRLAGHVTPRAQHQFDTGEAPSSLALKGLEIVFARSPAQQRDLLQLIEDQQNRSSPHYHQWLTPAQYGSRFGASDATVAAVSRWLKAGGFSVDAPPADRAYLRFHGSKAQVESAFQLQIHTFNTGGTLHFAALSDPAVPVTLAPAITAIRGLHDFYMRSSARSRSQAAHAFSPLVTYDGGKDDYVAPGDFAVMYNVTPLYQLNGFGGGVTIAIAGESDIDPSVANTFWNGVGDPETPSFSSMPVPGGQDPGQTNDSNETEAYLDVEIAGALAPGASILLVRDADVQTAFEYVIHQNLAAILNISFGACESELGSDNSVVESDFQEAATLGITVTVAAGDAGAASCATTLFTQGDLSTTGYAVSGVASTAYTLSVGGTDFDPTQPQDWATSNTSVPLASAEAHIPEMVWNDTCANPQFAQALSMTTSALCNTATLKGQPNPFLEVSGGGGGLSSCLTLSSNACQGGHAAPSWQTNVYGLAGIRTRAVPDVSMIATNWIICSYDNSTCDPTNGDVDIVGGTSAAAPSVAAIIAILDEGMSTTGSPDGRQGLLNPQLYALAATEYGTAAAPASGAGICSATLGTTIGPNCVFYNVTVGTNAMPCKVSTYSDAGSLPASTCTAATGEANGIMSISAQPQYLAGTGYNAASGLGSLNAASLIRAIYLPPPAGLAAQVSGQTITLSWTTEAHATGYDVYQATQPGQEVAVQSGLKSGSATVAKLQPGTTYYFTVAAESALGESAQSSEIQATTVPVAPTGLAATAGNATVSLSWTGSSGATSYNVYQGTSSGGEAATPVATGLTTKTTTLSGLSNGTAYYFTVAAVDAGGASAKSNEAQATPTAPASGGGGAIGWLESLCLGFLVVVRTLRVRAAGRQRRPA